jgi:hypothetical protein
MRRSLLPILALGLSLAGAQTASATDYWDLASESDNGTFSDNELVHGTFQQHDLQANPGPTADQDWYLVFNYPQSSYEMIVESTGGDTELWIPGSVDRLDTAGTTVIQSAEPAQPGVVNYATALRWQSTMAVIETNFVRVQSIVCTTGCGPEDQYHVRYYDTTVAIPRFNNSSGQITVLLIQNPLGWNRNINGTVYFWNTAGTMVGSTTFSIPARGAQNINTATIAPGIAGTITVAHDGGYGNLAIKTVALEPATGFSFDSPGVYRLH